MIEALSAAVLCKTKVECVSGKSDCAVEALPMLECKCTVATGKDSSDNGNSSAHVKGVFDASSGHRMCTVAGDVACLTIEGDC